MCICVYVHVNELFYRCLKCLTFLKLSQKRWNLLILSFRACRYKTQSMLSWVCGTSQKPQPHPQGNQIPTPATTPRAKGITTLTLPRMNMMMDTTQQKPGREMEDPKNTPGTTWTQKGQYPHRCIISTLQITQKWRESQLFQKWPPSYEVALTSVDDSLNLFV